MNAPITRAEAIAACDVAFLIKVLRTDFLRGNDNIPNDLKMRKAWLVWKLTEINPHTGKFNKIPCYPRNLQNRRGEQGSEADMANLGTWDEALKAFNKHSSIAGVGFALVPSFQIVALDIDHCVDNGDLRDDAKQITDFTYCEISPSGAGVRAFWQGEARDGKNHEEGYELFHAKGFVTVTGNQVENDHVLFGSNILPVLNEETQNESQVRNLL